jgi:hypothetical protein
MTPADDNLALGTALTIIGFGETAANTANSQRYEVARSIETITNNQFLYSQTDNKGACEGDSGGPAIAQTSSGPRVAGITSFGDPTCNMVGASVRISPVYAFISAFIAAAPKTLSCDECSVASVAPGNSCVNQGLLCGQGSSPCGKLIACLDACQNDACATQCASANPQGASQYNDVVTCQCGGMCQTACANLQACGGTESDPGTQQASFNPGITCPTSTNSTGAAGTGGAAGSPSVTGAAGMPAATGAAAGSSGSSAAAGGASGCGCDLAASTPGWIGVMATCALLALAISRRRARR